MCDNDSAPYDYEEELKETEEGRKKLKEIKNRNYGNQPAHDAYDEFVVE